MHHGYQQALDRLERHMAKAVVRLRSKIAHHKRLGGPHAEAHIRRLETRLAKLLSTHAVERKNIERRINPSPPPPPRPRRESKRYEPKRRTWA